MKDNNANVNESSAEISAQNTDNNIIGKRGKEVMEINRNKNIELDKNDIVEPNGNEVYALHLK